MNLASLHLLAVRRRGEKRSLAEYAAVLADAKASLDAFGYQRKTMPAFGEKKGGRPRADDTELLDRLLAAVRTDPGRSLQAYARALGVGTDRCRRCMRALAKRGEVEHRKVRGGYAIPEAA